MVGSYVSIKVWEPNFVPTKSKIASTTIWVRLPSLLNEFYDKSILEKIDRRIGCLLKIDTCTSSTLRGRYVRICIQVQMEKPVHTSIGLGNTRNQFDTRERAFCTQDVEC